MLPGICLENNMAPQEKISKTIKRNFIHRLNTSRLCSLHLTNSGVCLGRYYSSIVTIINCFLYFNTVIQYPCTHPCFTGNKGSLQLNSHN